MNSLIVFTALLSVACAAKLDWRIIGGQTAADGQFPYEVSLRYMKRHNCGAAILNEYWILTAAHCVIDSTEEPEFLTVVAGSNTLDAGGDTYQVVEVVVHDGFSFDHAHNDIALLRLKSPVQYNTKVQPIELNEEPIGDDEDLVLSGWGTTSYPGNTPNEMQWLPLKSVSWQKCNEGIWWVDWNVDETQVCTFTKYGQGACHGDSGSPLVYKGKVAGLASWVSPCAIGDPDVFTSVSSYVDWIRARIN